ncbi:response regulator transcription factor [Cohnella suwonensis]|uniref:Response regulator transcription factor n=1 Tax=Cohnella suwonensis TaxID=696072 RepID=A0ABW0LWF9_9BACL
MIVDDDSSIVKITKLYLTKNGYDVEEAYDGERALALIGEGAYDLVVLDLMLPKLDGWAVCRRLRENGDDTPIVMLTARGEVHERIEGLQLGADDYLVKPFDPHELLARIATVLRRAGRGGVADSEVGNKGSSRDGKTLFAGNLTLRPESYEVSVGGETASLTRREFELLAYLARRPGKVLSREDLIAALWGWDFDGEDRVVDLYVQRIRRKLGPGEGWNLGTVWGVGYKFEVGP